MHRHLLLRLAWIACLLIAGAGVAQPDSAVNTPPQRAAIRAADLRVRAVFSGETLPGVGLLSGERITALLGPHAYRVDYYDNDYQPVTTADAPGRYAAVATVTPEGGEPITRVATLFRTPGPVNRRDAIDVQLVELPDGYGFPADVLESHGNELNEAIGRQATRWLMYDPDGAELLAALYESTPGSDEGQGDPLLTMNRVTTDADAWAFGLRKHLDLIEHRYRTDLPEGYDDDPNKKWPLVVFLHGAGERGHELEKVAWNGPAKHVRNGKQFPFVLVSPQCDAGSWWSIAQVNDIVTEAMTKYRIDPDRVYLTGLSMGGYGTWATAGAHPDRFAAIAPVCGGGNPQDAPVLAAIPTWAFHGDADGVVPPEQSIAMADAITEVDDTLFKLTIYEGVGHNAWDPAYEDERLYEWLLSNERGKPVAPPSN